MTNNFENECGLLTFRIPGLEEIGKSGCSSSTNDINFPTRINVAVLKLCITYTKSNRHTRDIEISHPDDWQLDIDIERVVDTPGDYLPHYNS